MPSIKFTLSFLQKKIPAFMINLISAMSIIKYMAIGLLVVASVLLVIILATWKNGSGTKEKPAENIGVLTPIQEVPIEVKISEKTKERNVFTMPMEGPVTLDFGWQEHPVYKDWRFHSGIDILGSEGQTVQAINSGQVVEIVTDKLMGLRIGIKNDNYIIYYGSLSQGTVAVGDHIHSGQIIGAVGSCEGENYNHLHLAIKNGDQYIDPKLLLVNK